MVRKTGVSLFSLGRLVVAILVLIALGTNWLAFAQTATATIVGVVKDASGALIPGVSITVKHTDTGQTRTAISSDSGYNVPLLPVGAYEISTMMPGFKQQVRSGVNLVIGQQAVIDLTLEVGAAAEQITVSEEAPLVNTTLSSTSGLITEQQVKDLPLNGRS